MTFVFYRTKQVESKLKQKILLLFFVGLEKSLKENEILKIFLLDKINSASVDLKKIGKSKGFKQKQKILWKAF